MPQVQDQSSEICLSICSPTRYHSILKDTIRERKTEEGRETEKEREKERDREKERERESESKRKRDRESV